MPIFQPKQAYVKETLYFCGSSQDWDNLIIKNSLIAKDVFVCDPCLCVKYPKHIKVIRSMDTARRFLLGFGGANSIVFINAERNPKFADTDSPFWNRTNCMIIKMNIKQLVPLLKSGFLEVSSKKNIRYLRFYS